MGFNSGFNSGFTGVGDPDYRLRTIDFSGDGGTLSDATVYSLAVRDPSGNQTGTVNVLTTGIGSSKSFTVLSFNPSVLFTDYDGSKDVLTLTLNTSAAITWGTEATGVWIQRAIGAGTPSQYLYGIRNAGSTNRLWQTATTNASSVTEAGQPTYDPRSFGLTVTPATSTAFFSTTDYGTAPFTTTQLASGLRVATEIANGTGANTFGTTDYVAVGLQRFSGTGTTTMTQNSSGITVTNDSFSFPMERLHIYYTPAR